MSRLTVYGGGGGTSPLTTKGDLYGYTTQGARVPVGADGQALVADSTQPLGVQWLVPPQLPPLTGQWVTPESHGLGTTNFSATQAGSANQMDMCALYLPGHYSATKIGIVVDTASASGSARLGIFDGAGRLLLDAGVVATTTTGEKIIALGAAVPLPLGWIYPVLLPDQNFTYRAYSPQRQVGAGSLNFSSAGVAWERQAVTYGPLPATAVVVLGNSGNGPRIGLVLS